MITPVEALNTIAVKYGHRDFELAQYRLQQPAINTIIIEAMEYYAEQSNSHKHGVMQVPQFEELLQVRLDELPYTKHLDDGQYNDGRAYGFECGARWAYDKLSSGTAVGRAGGQSSD